MKRTIPSLCIVSVLILMVRSGSAAENQPVRREWTVDGILREALIYVPPQAKYEATPIVFTFHGHGGTMLNAARAFGCHTLWPEVIVVYMQGLKTPGKLTDPEGKLPGWQFEAGDQQDRDLKFFDAVLDSLQQDYKIDENRLYATGHSNGGTFTYLLWATRGDRFAALAPSAAVGGKQLRQFKPKPVLLVAGESDRLVKFEWQQRMIDAVKKVNECEAGRPWGEQKWCTLYPSPRDAPVVTCIHPGGHNLPPEVPAMIIKFFKEHSRAR